jgi:NAD(P)H-nitrite reductase large subunit
LWRARNSGEVVPLSELHPAVTVRLSHLETMLAVLVAAAWVTRTGSKGWVLRRDAAGIKVKRGIVVDDRMQTSAPGIYAAGDVAEHDGRVLGLWPIAAKQGEVAALNALGGDERLSAEIPATILKGVGLELSSIGRVEPETGDELIVVEDARRSSYRRLILSNGVVVGALIIGHHPEDLAAATAAVKKQLQLDAAARAALRAGDWRSLKPTSRVPAGI